MCCKHLVLRLFGGLQNSSPAYRAALLQDKFVQKIFSRLNEQENYYSLWGSNYTGKHSVSQVGKPSKMACMQL